MKRTLIVGLLCLLTFGCQKDGLSDGSKSSSADSDYSAWIFLALVALVVYSYLLYIWEREKRRDAISQIHKEMAELSSKLERHHQRIVEQGNLITSLRTHKTDNKQEENPDPWGKIRKGMTEEEVNNVLSAPMAIFPSPSGEMYHYGQADMEGQVFFENGKVVYYAKPKVDKKLTDLEVFRHLYLESIPTKENNSSGRDIQSTKREVDSWEKIEKGMTEKEVIELVGKPYKIQALTDTDELWRFGPPYSNRQITFSCGKVVGFDRS